MSDRLSSRRAVLGGTAAVLGTLAAGRLHAAVEPNRFLIVVGPSQHPPGTHEVAAGGRLLEYALNSIGKSTGLRANAVSEWPADASELADVASIVFIGDLFPPEVMPQRDRIMKQLAAMMKRGCGIVCIHYATGLEAKHVATDGDHPLLHWIGGYFATRCQHHQSIAKVFREATVLPGQNDHPVLRGWKSFTFHDEPYINNYFGAKGPANNVSILATANLPPEAPKPETIAWAVERTDGGRGAGIVMPHFYRNWKIDNLRTLILNAILWTAGKDVPANGVRVDLPDLARFKPAAVEPPIKKPKE